MGRARAARRLAAAALYGGGGLGVVGGAAIGVLKTEARLARRALGTSDERPPSPEGRYGARLPGEPIRLVLIGDSAAVGYGVTAAADTPGGLLGEGLAQIAGRPVDVRTRARVGATSGELEEQITAAVDEAMPPDVVVIVVGANDVTQSVKQSDAVRALDEAVRRLLDLGSAVVVGTCPDLGTVRPLRQPLRLLAQRASRHLAAAQMITVVEAGGRAVSLADLLARDFHSAPDELFGADHFHPSEQGYASMVAAMLPTVAASVGAWDDDEDLASYPGGVVLPVAFAAAEAARVAGTELTQTAVAGRERGPRGRWAALRRRR